MKAISRKADNPGTVQDLIRWKRIYENDFFKLNATIKESGYRQLFLNSRPSTAQPRVKSAGLMRLTELLDKQQKTRPEQTPPTNRYTTTDNSRPAAGLIDTSLLIAVDRDANIESSTTSSNCQGVRSHNVIPTGASRKLAHRALTGSAPPLRNRVVCSSAAVPAFVDKRRLDEQSCAASPIPSNQNLTVQVPRKQISTTSIASPQQVVKRESVMLITPSFWRKRDCQLLRRPLEGKRHFRLQLELDKLPAEENYTLLPMLDYTFVTVQQGDARGDNAFYASHYPLLLSVVPVWKAKQQNSANKSEERVPFYSRSTTFLKITEEILDPQI